MAIFVSPRDAVMLGYVLSQRDHSTVDQTMDQVRRDERYSPIAKGLAEKLYKGRKN